MEIHRVQTRNWEEGRTAIQHMTKKEGLNSNHTSASEYAFLGRSKANHILHNLITDMNLTSTIRYYIQFNENEIPQPNEN